VRITYSEDQNNIIKFKAKLLLKTNLIICISETRQKAKVFRLVSLSFLKSLLQLVTLSNIKVHFYFIWTKINWEMLTVSFFTKFSTKKTKRDVNNSLKKYSSRVLVECSTKVISTIQKVTDKLKKSIFFLL